MALLLGSTAMAQTFEQALDAYERKDYKTAFAGFMRLAQGEAAAAPEPEAAKEDQQQRVAKYRKAAEQGDAAAQFIMGLVYFDGRGVAQDDRQAETWTRSRDTLIAMLPDFYSRQREFSGMRRIGPAFRGMYLC